MPLNNGQIGLHIKRALTRSIYFQNYDIATEKPPNETFILVSNDDQQLATNSEKILITNGVLGNLEMLTNDDKQLVANSGEYLLTNGGV